MLPMAGEYTGGVMRDGIRRFVATYRPDLLLADDASNSERMVRAPVTTAVGPEGLGVLAVLVAPDAPEESAELEALAAPEGLAVPAALVVLAALVARVVRAGRARA